MPWSTIRSSPTTPPVWFRIRHEKPWTRNCGLARASFTKLQELRGHGPRLCRPRPAPSRFPENGKETPPGTHPACSVYASLCTSRYPAQDSRPSGSLLLSPPEELSSSASCGLSGKVVARSGLRMMPTFPPPPLSVGSRSGAVSLRFRLPGAPRFLWEWTH
jgi:hypothetical protein